MDRAEPFSLTEMLYTPAGNFVDCPKIEETMPLEPGVRAHKSPRRESG